MMQFLVVLDVMRKSQGQKNVFFHFVINFMYGIQKNQQPELWNIYNGKIRKGESIRVFPFRMDRT